MKKTTKNLLLTGLSICLLVSSIVLSSPIGRVQADTTFTATLRPVANGDLQQIGYQYPSSGNHWDKEDEVSLEVNAWRGRGRMSIPKSGPEGIMICNMLEAWRMAAKETCPYVS